MKTLTLCIAAFCLMALSTACREDETVIRAQYDPVGDVGVRGGVQGLYILNEGNMGSNKCTLDFYDYRTGGYLRNFYAERNPSAIKELGDVGNDIAVYGSRLYIAVNCSHKVEVLDARSGVSIGRIPVPNCRYLQFHGPHLYVSSYVGEVGTDPTAPKGAVFEVDTASLAITRRVTVGYQPEQMAILDGLLYVANSGGYRAPDYDNTLSVVRLSDMRQIRRIPLAPNLHCVAADRYSRLWVSSREAGPDSPAKLFMLAPSGTSAEMQPAASFDIAASAMAIHDDTLYWLDSSTGPGIKYGSLDLPTLLPSAAPFITDGTDAAIKRPYGLAIHPVSGDIFVTDAKNYVSSGTLYCFSPVGRLKWSVRTGDIPAHIAFLTDSP